MSYLSLLNKSITLERPTNSQDTSGGITKTFAVVNGAEDLRAAIQPLSTREQMLFAQRQIMVTHRIYLAGNIPPRVGDRVRVPATNQLFVVIGYRNQAGRDQVWSIDAREQT